MRIDHYLSWILVIATVGWLIFALLCLESPAGSSVARIRRDLIWTFLPMWVFAVAGLVTSVVAEIDSTHKGGFWIALLNFVFVVFILIIWVVVWQEELSPSSSKPARR